MKKFDNLYNSLVSEENKINALQRRRELGYKPYEGTGEKKDTHWVNHIVDQIAEHAEELGPRLLLSTGRQILSIVARHYPKYYEEYAKDVNMELPEGWDK